MWIDDPVLYCETTGPVRECTYVERQQVRRMFENLGIS